MGTSCIDSSKAARMMACLSFQEQYAVEGKSPVAKILVFILFMQFYFVAFAHFSQIFCDVFLLHSCLNHPVTLLLVFNFSSA
jgi:hypothetical protein